MEKSESEDKKAKIRTRLRYDQRMTRGQILQALRSLGLFQHFRSVRVQEGGGEEEIRAVIRRGILPINLRGV